MTPSDGDVVERVRAGDTEAFGVLVNRYYGRCIRYALHMVEDEELAADLVQESFLRAYQSLGGYDHRGRFDRWLLSIVANRARTAAAAQSKRNGRSAPLDQRVLPVSDGMDESRSDPFLRNQVSVALARLSPALREAVVLRYVEEMSYVEMAEATGLRPSALKMRVARAKQALRRELEGLDR